MDSKSIKELHEAYDKICHKQTVLHLYETLVAGGIDLEVSQEEFVDTCIEDGVRTLEQFVSILEQCETLTENPAAAQAQRWYHLGSQVAPTLSRSGQVLHQLRRAFTGITGFGGQSLKKGDSGFAWRKVKQANTGAAVADQVGLQGAGMNTALSTIGATRDFGGQVNTEVEKINKAREAERKRREQAASSTGQSPAEWGSK